MNYDVDELKTIVIPIAKRYGVKSMSLFGSRARGDCTMKSDYDFCIVPDDNMSLLDLSNLRLDLVDALETNVDVICEDSINPKFYEVICNDKRILYEN